jgi:hypothetical protein
MCVDIDYPDRTAAAGVPGSFLTTVVFFDSFFYASGPPGVEGFVRAFQNIEVTVTRLFLPLLSCNKPIPFRICKDKMPWL